MIVLHSDTVSAEYAAGIRIGGGHHEIARQIRTDIVGSRRIQCSAVVHRVFQQLFIIAERTGRRIGQRHRSVFYRLVPFLVVEVKTGRERIGRTLVEMVLGHRIDDVVYQRQSLFDILLDLGVDLGDGSALVFGIEFRLGLLHIGNTEIVGMRRIVMLAENVHQHEVGVGTADKRFALCGAQFVGHLHLVDGLEHLVGVSDSHVVGFPRVSGVFVVGFGRIAPFIALLPETAPAIVIGAVVIGIVGSHFEEKPRLAVRISRYQHLDSLLFRIDNRPVVRLLVEEIVTGGESRNKKSRKQEIYQFVRFHML